MTHVDTSSAALDIRPFVLGWTEPALSPAVLITYDSETFETAAFARHGIDMPASIVRSVRKRQAEFFMGRLAARRALAAIGVADRSIAIGPSRQPEWPSGVVGSITHAGGYAAAVAMRAGSLRGIGIDIEKRIGEETRASVEATVISPDEQSFLRSLSGELPYDMLLTMAFSAKESFFKAAFSTVGTYFDFDAVHLTALDASDGTIGLVVTRRLAEALPDGSQLSLRGRLIDAETVITSFVW